MLYLRHSNKFVPYHFHLILARKVRFTTLLMRIAVCLCQFRACPVAPLADRSDNSPQSGCADYLFIYLFILTSTLQKPYG